MRSEPVAAKICGLSTPETVRAALEGGAAFVGFVFFAASPRNVRADFAARLAEPARGRAGVVAVTVDADDQALDALMATFKPDFIQLHGRESPERAATVRVRTGVGVIKALPVSESADLSAASAYDGVVDHLMFDAKPPRDSSLPGGVGASFDWALLEGRRFSRPHFLAGGLDPWNVREATKLSGAPLVDVSSGVERGPGLKDAGLISAFLDAARRA
ncbi:MAG TPA: phosphoribosylanthranilate isomerase [Caulobacteraceae bacterium]|jgi:phosphoribosylanthranilate isomerase